MLAVRCCSRSTTKGIVQRKKMGQCEMVWQCDTIVIGIIRDKTNTEK